MSQRADPLQPRTLVPAASETEAGPSPRPLAASEPAGGDAKSATAEDVEAQKERKRQKKRDRKARQEQRGLRPWERYRALTDAYETAQDLLEFGDRKVRFGLIVIGAINLFVFGLAFRSQSVASLPAEWLAWIIAYLGLYACVLVYGVSHAISALRPRIQPPEANTPRQTGLHFYEDILRQAYPEYERAWRDIPINDLNSLLTRQTYSLAYINRAKFKALQRMYTAINLMVTMGGGLLVMAVLIVFGQRASLAGPSGEGIAGAPAEVGSGPLFTSREYKIMLPPERFMDAGRSSEESIRRGTLAYWGLVAAEQSRGGAVRLSAIESQVVTGPTRHRLLHFVDAEILPADADCKALAPTDAFLFDCKSLVLRSRVSVKPFEPTRGFEIDATARRPVELTLKSRSAFDLRTAQEQGIRALEQIAGAPAKVEYKVEKDMAVGRSTYGQSATVAMTMAQASSLFTGRAPNGPGIPLPSDLTELQRLFSAPQLRGAANRSLVPVPDYAAYEQVYKIEDAIGFPGGYDSALTMSFWFDMRKQLRVVEASWRLHPKGAAETPLPSQVVGSAEQFLDGLLALSQRNGWWNAAAQTKKKAQALSAAGA